MSHQNINTLTGQPLPAAKPDRVVTFTRCVSMDLQGHGRKVRGTLRLWLRAASNYDESRATLEMWVDDDDGPQLQLRPEPAGFVQTRDLISHGMEIVSVIEAVTETEFFYDDPILQKAMIEAAAEVVAQTPFEQAVAKLDIGDISPKTALLGAGTKTIGQIK